jgi:hypothetical protein
MNQQAMLPQEFQEDVEVKSKQKTPLQSIDHLIFAITASIIIPFLFHMVFMSFEIKIYNFIFRNLPENLFIFFLPANTLLWIFLSAWFSGIVLGTWMPKNIKKALKWVYGLGFSPFYIIYIFPQVQRMWQRYQEGGETSLPKTMVYIVLNLVIYPATFFGVYNGAKWASKRGLKRLEKMENAKI